MKVKIEKWADGNINIKTENKEDEATLNRGMIVRCKGCGSILFFQESSHYNKDMRARIASDVPEDQGVCFMTPSCMLCNERYFPLIDDVQILYNNLN